MNLINYKQIKGEVSRHGAGLIAVSKTKPVSDILLLYQEGQRLFGENKVQELVSKQRQLPSDIKWHMIGHLQRNKAKMIAPFVSMIHSVDSLRLLEEINKQAEINNRVIKCLLQIHIAKEETKFGLDETELMALLESSEFQYMKNIEICGLMGMATNTENTNQIEQEFENIKMLFEQVKNKYFKNDPSFSELSIGMSGDYQLALKHGATLVRIGSLLFGER